MLLSAISAVCDQDIYIGDTVTVGKCNLTVNEIAFQMVSFHLSNPLKMPPSLSLKLCFLNIHICTYKKRLMHNIVNKLDSH